MACHHAGPAGSRFCSIEHAGRYMLKLHCNNYPCTTQSYILPPLFLSQFPEGHDPTTSKPEPRIAPPLSGNEQNKFAGICSGQGGELTEHKVFYLFTKLLEEEQDVPLLILRDFELDTKGKGNLKRKALMSEYPQITSIDMRGQQDCIIILKDLGFICIEVKRKLSAESVQKAKDQLDRSELFLNDIILAIAPNSYRLPILKLVMFELDDLQLSNSPGYHFFDCSGDSITAFKLKWRILKQELPLLENRLTSLEFKLLARLLTGIWSMKSLNRQTYFDVNDASLPHLTKQVDFSVDHAHLCSDAKRVERTKKDPKDPPLTNVIFNQQGTVFREANEINLMYLTPEQKNIYDNVRCGIIRGAAGTGKTLLVLFKIIDLVQSHNSKIIDLVKCHDNKITDLVQCHDNRKITLFAPHPHTLRCKNILEANGVRVMESEDTPLETETLYDVVIMDIRNFHSVLSSPCPMFLKNHIFIDDFQSSFDNDRMDEMAHGVTLMKSGYEIAALNNLYFWCMDDTLQQTSSTFNASDTKQFYEHFFSTLATVPTYTLNNILRSTKVVSNVVLEVREKVKSLSNLPSVDAHSSHNITSTLPTIHILMGRYDDDVVVDYIVERLEEELRPLVCTTNPIPLSDIAVLYVDRSSSINNEKLRRTREMLSTMFNIIPMTIEQQLKSDNPTVVFDDVRNTTSGEWPVAICLGDDTLPFTSSYIGFSRARTRLTVIDYRKVLLGIPHTHVMHVRWRWENSKFVSDNSS